MRSPWPLYRFRNAGDFIPHLPEIIAVAIKRIPGLRGAIANWKPGLLETLSNYSHLEAEYLIENDYSCRQLDEPDISKIWQWVQFSRILLPQLRVKTQGDEDKSGVKARLRKLVQTLIQASLQEHRTIKYVERLNSGNLPPWIK